MFSGLKSRYPEMPSWAIDWSIFDEGSQVNSATGVNMTGLYRFHSPSGEYPARFYGNCLLIRRFICDYIIEVAEAAPQSEDWNNNVWCSHWLAMVSNSRCPEHTYPPLSTQSWNEAWLRTLCNDICYGQNAARRINKVDVDFLSAMISERHPKLAWQTREMEPRFAGERLVLENGHEVPAEAHFNDLFMMMRMAVAGRKLFLTKKGYLGIGNWQISLGDQIGILTGAHTPLILRGVELHTADLPSLKSSFRVISEGYVHGLMDGEPVLGGNPLLTIMKIV
jgi:hypothetical protein